MNHSKKQDEVIRYLAKILDEHYFVSHGKEYWEHHCQDKINSILSEEEITGTRYEGNGSEIYNKNHIKEPSLEEKLEKIQEWRKNNNFSSFDTIKYLHLLDLINALYNEIK